MDYFQFVPSNPWLVVGWRTREKITLPIGQHLRAKGIEFIASAVTRERNPQPRRQVDHEREDDARRGRENVRVRSGCQRRRVHWAKIAFEKYFLYKMKRGTSEPLCEKSMLRLLGIHRLEGEQK